MKIYSITPGFNLQKNNYVSGTPTTSTPAALVPKTLNLNGVPRAYISFGENNKINDKKRRAEIAKYLEYRDKAKDLERGDVYYNELVNARIEGLIKERSHYGSITGKYKIGKVKKLERLRIKKELYEKYIHEKEEYKKIKENESYYKGLISTEDIEVYEKVKQKLSERASLDKKIAGYAELKDTVKKLIIDPIQRETALDTNEKLPPALLLYGPIGCGKSKLAKAIAQEANCNVVEFPAKLNPRKFAGEIKDTMDEAKSYYESQKKLIDNKYNDTRYKNGNIDQKASYIANLKSPRTIVVIDEVDQYFNPNTAGNSEDIADVNKTLLKGLLDYCSEQPGAKTSADAAGVTFIFTTNYPTIVDSEISLRNGKCKRAQVALPEDSDIKDIMKFYIVNSANPAIQEAKEHGKNVNPLDAEQIPYNSYLKFVQPTQETGAFSGAGIESAVKQAAVNYISDPEMYMNIHLAKLLSSGVYRIPMDKLEEYKKEMEAMGKLLKDIDEKEEYELLKDLKELDMITPKQQTRLELLKSAYETSGK